MKGDTKITIRSGDPCPVCRETVRFLYTIERFDPVLQIGICNHCRLQMQLDVTKDPSDYYSEDYYTGNQQYTYRDERKTLEYDRIVHNARLKTIQKYAKDSRFLDTGCSFGGFTESASLAGFDATGIDVSKYAVDYGISQGRRLIHGDLFSPELTKEISQNGRFDCITLIEVIEHLADPQRVFQRLSELLNNEGLLVLQTADFGGQQAIREKENYHYYLPGHLFYYSASNLKNILTQHGLEVVKIFRPVDFALSAKLKKSAGSFEKATDYFRWLRIAWYHMKGKIHFGSFALTSSMVLYARKVSS